MELFGKVWKLYYSCWKKEAAAEWNEGLKSKTLRDWKKPSRTAWSKLWKVISKAGESCLLTCAGKINILRFPKKQEWCDVDSPLPVSGRAVFICEPRTFFLGCHVWHVQAIACLGGRRVGIRTEFSSEHIWSRAQNLRVLGWERAGEKESRTTAFFVGEFSLFLTHVTHPCCKLCVFPISAPEIGHYLFGRTFFCVYEVIFCFHKEGIISKVKPVLVLCAAPLTEWDPLSPRAAAGTASLLHLLFGLWAVLRITAFISNSLCFDFS